MQDARHFGRTVALGRGPLQEFATSTLEVGVVRVTRRIGDSRTAKFSPDQEALALQLAVRLLDRGRANRQRDGHGADRRQLLTGTQDPQANLLPDLGLTSSPLVGNSASNVGANGFAATAALSGSALASSVPAPPTAIPEMTLRPLPASDWTTAPLPITSAPPVMVALSRST